MRFPTAHVLHTTTFFHNVRLQSDTLALLKVRKWSAEVGAKGKLPEAWFQIKGILMEKRSTPNVCKVSSLVGGAKQVGKENMLKFDYVMVLIQCTDPQQST